MNHCDVRGNLLGTFEFDKMPSNLKTIHDSSLLVFDKISCINNNDLDYVNTDRKDITNNGENNITNNRGNDITNNGENNIANTNGSSNNNSSRNDNNDNNQHCKDNIPSINSDIKTSNEIMLLNNQNNDYQHAKETKIKSDYLEINNQYKNENKNEINARSSSDFSKFNLLSSNSNSNEFLNSGNSYFFQPEKSIFVKKCIGDEEAANSLKQFTWMECSINSVEDSIQNSLLIINAKKKRKREDILNKCVDKDDIGSDTMKYEKLNMTNTRFQMDSGIKDEVDEREGCYDGTQFNSHDNIPQNVLQNDYIKNEIE